MCVYCKKNEAGNVTPIRNGGTSEWYVDIEDTDLYVEYDEDGGCGHGAALIGINFCPMCGRRLGGEN